MAIGTVVVPVTVAIVVVAEITERVFVSITGVVAEAVVSPVVEVAVAVAFFGIVVIRIIALAVTVVARPPRVRPFTIWEALYHVQVILGAIWQTVV